MEINTWFLNNYFIFLSVLRPFPLSVHTLFVVVIICFMFYLILHSISTLLTTCALCGLQCCRVAFCWKTQSCGWRWMLRNDSIVRLLGTECVVCIETYFWFLSVFSSFFYFVTLINWLLNKNTKNLSSHVIVC